MNEFVRTYLMTQIFSLDDVTMDFLYFDINHG